MISKDFWPCYSIACAQIALYGLYRHRVLVEVLIVSLLPERHIVAYFPVEVGGVVAHVKGDHLTPDAQHLRTHDQPSLGATGAGGGNDILRLQTKVAKILQQFFARLYITP